jgi:hypothetical protein
VDDPDPDMGFKNRHFETYKDTGITEGLSRSST